jgi:hypothetical protein
VGCNANKRRKKKNSLKTFTKAKNVQSYTSSPPHTFMVHTGTTLHFIPLQNLLSLFGKAKRRTEHRLCVTIINSW